MSGGSPRHWGPCCQRHSAPYCRQAETLRARPQQSPHECQPQSLRERLLRRLRVRPQQRPQQRSQQKQRERLLRMLTGRPLQRQRERRLPTATATRLRSQLLTWPASAQLSA